MANVVNGVSPASFDPSGKDGNTQFQALAKAGGQNQQSLAAIVSNFGFCADFIISSSTDTAAALTLIDLTAAGMTLPTGFQRIIMLDCFSKAAATNAAYKKVWALVVGGTDPTLFFNETVFAGANTALDTELVFDVSINTTPTPDTVIVRAATVPAVALTHRIYVTISPLLVI